MHPLTFLSLAALTLAASPAGAAPQQVIELYQSQGCSSCPPANAVLNDLADRKDLITLSFAVTYWDYLGWKDGFAQPGFTQRQSDYANTNRRPNVSTPQMVINGRGFLVGTTAAEVAQGLKTYARTGPEPEITMTGDRLGIGAGSGAAQVWLVRYDPKRLDVPISAGENTGRTLPHRHIVKQLIRIADWSGKPVTATLPPTPTGLQTAILLQAGRGGPIIAAKTF
jgi:hypothetical protein